MRREQAPETSSDRSSPGRDPTGRREDRRTRTLPLAYVVPIRADVPVGDELARYLRRTSTEVAELVVVDGSTPDVVRANRRSLQGLHVIRPSRVTANGKVGGVLSGLAASTQDAVVIADEDVRYEPEDLAKIAFRLRVYDAVVPQNVFHPSPWHARWDTARSLIHRAIGADMPGTIALRPSALPAGYDGDVLFENLELIRTIEAGGGRVSFARDLFVRRRPPTTRHFWSQRVRQAYDEFARPGHMLVCLSILPITVAVARRKAAPVLGVAIASIAIAELGRRRDGGRVAFRPTATLWAPIWVGERAICSWLALIERLRGGVRYHGVRLRRAGTPVRRLRRRARTDRAAGVAA